MTTFYKDLNSLTEADLLQLIEDKTIESQQLEYKRDKPREPQWKEAVASFANSKGGDLLVGIQEKDGYPDQLIGIEMEDPDKETMRINNLLNTGLDPSFRLAMIRCILLENGRYVIVVRTPKSWNAPHMVKDSGKFMKRTNSNKLPMEADEVRRMMNGRYDFIQLYDEFREKRIQKAKDTYQVKPPYVLIHYVPLSAFESIDMYPVVQNRNILNHSLLGSSSYVPIINAYGTMHRDHVNKLMPNLEVDFNITKSYYIGHTQIFNNGIIEQISSYPFNYANEINLELPKDFFHTTTFKEKLATAFKKQAHNYEVLDMKDPFYIFFEMVGVNGVIGHHAAPIYGMPSIRIDEENLRMPEILIESFNEHQQHEAVERIMMFLWNTFGFDEPQTDDRLLRPHNDL